MGNSRHDFALADLLGVCYVGKTEFKANFFRMPDTYAKGFEPNYDIFLTGPSNIVEAKKGSSIGELKMAFHDRDLHTHVGHAPNNSPWKAVGPALVRNEYGRGEVAYLSFSPEAA